MPLKIYNVLTRKKEAFEPITPGKVRMYVCGITPYDECHLGHARAAVVFDVIYRYLKYSKYDVTYVRNFTDVDDKIIKRASETSVLWSEIAKKYIDSYREQMKRLGVETPTHEPLCTENIPEMIALIQKIIENGYAYVSGNDVFFEVRKFKNYGKLSHKKIDELESGARVEVDDKKRDPLDFALWKGAKMGEPSWPTPWGEGRPSPLEIGGEGQSRPSESGGAGRPGWHIECSAMSIGILGEQFDIHGGGRDLAFPHHENEIAQSEGATGKEPFARFWIHNGFVNINAEKMSKSLGNFRSIPAILEQWDPEVVRYFLLSAHYASPLDFTDGAMANAEEALSRLYETLLRLKQAPAGSETMSIDFHQVIEKGMEDDFNTNATIGEVFRYLRQINSFLDKGQGWVPDSQQQILRGIREIIGGVLGIFNSDPAEFLERRKRRGLQSSSINESEITELIEARQAARSGKDFKRADQIRNELAAKGVQIKDNPDGTTSWEIKR